MLSTVCSREARFPGTARQPHLRSGTGRNPLRIMQIWKLEFDWKATLEVVWDTRPVSTTHSIKHSEAATPSRSCLRLRCGVEARGAEIPSPRRIKAQPPGNLSTSLRNLLMGNEATFPSCLLLVHEWANLQGLGPHVARRRRRRRRRKRQRKRKRKKKRRRKRKRERERRSPCASSGRDEDVGGGETVPRVVRQRRRKLALRP